MKRAVFGAIVVSLQVVQPLKPAPDVHVAAGALAARALERPIAGIAVAVGRIGSVSPSVARGFGFADVDRKVPITPNAVFHIASVSKNIEAAVVLKLVEEGRLSLDEDITKYVAEAPTQGKRVTVRQLLNHTSGIHSFTSIPDAEANESREMSHAEVLALVKDQPFDFEPGTSWRYSNTGFYLVGMAIERVTGMPYAEYVRERVFHASQSIDDLAGGRIRLTMKVVIDWELQAWVMGFGPAAKVIQPPAFAKRIVESLEETRATYLRTE